MNDVSFRRFVADLLDSLQRLLRGRLVLGSDLIQDLSYQRVDPRPTNAIRIIPSNVPPRFFDGRLDVRHKATSFTKTLYLPAARPSTCRRRPVPHPALWVAGFSIFFSGPALALQTESVRLQSAGVVEVSMEVGRRVLKFGDSVLFDYAGYHLAAGRLTLDETVGRAWAENGVTLTGPGGSARASRVWIELATERIVLEDLEARLGPWNASAARAEMLGDQIDLHDAYLTACPGGVPIYSLKARKLSKETPERFVARGVTPYFYRIPFFYLPRYTYELDKDKPGEGPLPSRQGFEMNPGRGKYSGLFVKTTWRRKFFDRRLLSTTHLDYYSKPGPAIGEEIQYRSNHVEHFTYAYVTRQRKIRRDGSYTRLSERETRWRLWQIWDRQFSFGHFKSFVNEVSDSQLEDDYRLNFDERRLREREISSELVFQRSNVRMKLIVERLKTLDIRGPSEYRLDHRQIPAVRFLSFTRPFDLWRRNQNRRGWRTYGRAGAGVAHGRDRPDRRDGVWADGEMEGVLTMPVVSLLTLTGQLGVRNDYREKKIFGESASHTPTGTMRWSLHRPWWEGRIQTDLGHSFEKSWANKSIFPAAGQKENRLFYTFQHAHKIWKTAFDAGYDLRPGFKQFSTLEFQTQAAGSFAHVSSVLRYDPKKNHAQSVYTHAGFSFNSEMMAGLGFQTVHTDTEVQIQFTPSVRFETPDKRYRYGFSGYYDAQASRWRTRELYLTRQFRCVETTVKLSKRDSDLEINFSFRLTGFGEGDEWMRRAQLSPSSPGAGVLSR